MTMDLYEEKFTKLVRLLTVSLIKNAVKPPAPLLQIAEEAEAGLWPILDPSIKLERLKELSACALDTSSPVFKLYDTYPHPYSKKRYADFVEALAAYQNELQKE